MVVRVDFVGLRKGSAVFLEEGKGRVGSRS